jgi:SAM-dependent methyltransferase
MKSNAWILPVLWSRLSLFLALFFSVISAEVNGQYSDWENTPNTWYTQPEGINWLIAHYRPIYDLQPHQKLASIGAGQGIREIVYSLMADSLTFYLQDINPVWLEPDRLSKSVRSIYSQAGRTSCTTKFVPVRGREKETGLPNQFFDKILVENSLHEFTFQPEMLQSIRGNLKPGGQLFIWEQITSKPNRRHSGCGKPIFTDESLLKLVEANGFRFVDKTIVDPPRGKDAVFRFQLKELPTSR